MTAPVNRDTFTMSRQCPLRLQFPTYRCIAANWSSLPWLRLLKQPTLVMAGTDDPIVPTINGRILASLIPNARLVTIEDGHLFLVTSAQESAQSISKFPN